MMGHIAPAPKLAIYHEKSAVDCYVNPVSSPSSSPHAGSEWAYQHPRPPEPSLLHPKRAYCHGKRSLHHCLQLQRCGGSLRAQPPRECERFIQPVMLCEHEFMLTYICAHTSPRSPVPKSDHFCLPSSVTSLHMPTVGFCVLCIHHVPCLCCKSVNVQQDRGWMSVDKLGNLIRSSTRTMLTPCT